ncbi:MAG: hypothetical protein EF813_08925 [Methanosarcinales archaeon]|nr:MAG: hypothetical protein EF813_08925 [Methanosarcinales archaeon]
MMLAVNPHGIDNGTHYPPLYQGVVTFCFTLHLAATGSRDPATATSPLDALMILHAATNAIEVRS